MARPKVGEERRQEIFSAFEACIVRKGLAGTTLQDVAEEARLPRSLVRYFIGNKADMVSALIDRLLERGEAQLRRLPAVGDVETTLDLLLDAVFSDPTTNIVIMELWYLALRDSQLRARLADIYEHLITGVAGHIARPEADPARHDQAFAAVALAFGAAFFRHLGIAPRSPQTLRDVSRQLLAQDFLINTATTGG